jgi:hypothetical protein
MISDFGDQGLMNGGLILDVLIGQINYKSNLPIGKLANKYAQSSYK